MGGDTNDGMDDDGCRNTETSVRPSSRSCLPKVGTPPEVAFLSNHTDGGSRTRTSATRAALYHYRYARTTAVHYYKEDPGPQEASRGHPYLLTPMEN